MPFHHFCLGDRVRFGRIVEIADRSPIRIELQYSIKGFVQRWEDLRTGRPCWMVIRRGGDSCSAMVRESGEEDGEVVIHVLGGI